MILEQNLALLRVMDCRGAPPLEYIRREHWGEWRRFFDMVKETYWAPMVYIPGGMRDDGGTPISTTTDGDIEEMDTLVVGESAGGGGEEGNEAITMEEEVIHEDSDTDETTTSESSSTSSTMSTAESTSTPIPQPLLP